MATITRGKAKGRTANRAARLARTRAAECRWPAIQASRRIPYTTTFLCYIDDLVDAGQTAATEEETVVYLEAAENVGNFLRGMVEAGEIGFALGEPGIGWHSGGPPGYPVNEDLAPTAWLTADAPVGHNLAAFIEALPEPDQGAVQHLLDGLVEKGLADL